MKRMLMVALLSIAATACSQGTPRATERSTTTTAVRQAQLIAALEPADSCRDLLDWIHQGARSAVGPYGLNSGLGYAVPQVGGPLRAQGASVGATTEAPLAQAATSPGASDKAAFGSADSAGTAAAADGSVVGTNDQEAGVDEPDQFKADSHRAVMTDGQRLMVVGLDGATPTGLGQLDLPMSGAQLFLRGDHVLAVGSGNQSNSATGLVVLVDVDLSGGAPKIAAQATVDGQLLDGRLADGTVRLVISTPEPSRVPFVSANSSDPAAVKRARAANQAAIDDSTIGQWLPSWTPPGGSPTPLEQCSSVFHPNQWAGSSMLSVLSITDSLADLHPVGVVTDGQTIYASPSALYVATQRTPDQQWNDDGTPKSVTADPAITAIHRFDISGQGPATYQGSGTVAGSLLNQYSLSEEAGDLRILTTTGSLQGGVIPEPMPCDTPGFACPMNGAVPSPGIKKSTADDAATSSDDPTTTDGTLLTVLRLQGDQLNTVGRLTGLAPGEQVKAVRFLGTQAYIVTFRQYDPLFVVDLTDPTAPKLLGQLTTPGFSAYLHPVEPNRLFGVGTAIGGNEPDGSKVSLYDTSDPTHPTEIAGFTIPGQGTTLDSDPHAFTWDADRHLAFVATTVGDPNGPTKTGMMVYRIDDHSITWVGWIDHDAHATTGAGSSSPGCDMSVPCPDVLPSIGYQYAAPVDRVIVVGDRALGASDSGVSVAPIDTFRESAWIGWSA